VEAIQERLICEEEKAETVREVGVVGGVVSGVTMMFDVVIVTDAEVV
jgi:hypothetical protein